MTNRWQNCWCILGGFLWAHGTFTAGENRRRGKQCRSKSIYVGTSVRDQAVVVLLLLSDNTRVPASFRYAWTWSLILSDVSDDDVGEYTCRISSSAPNDQTLTIIKRFHLTVLSKRLNLTSICDFPVVDRNQRGDGESEALPLRMFDDINDGYLNTLQRFRSCNRPDFDCTAKAFFIEPLNIDRVLTSDTNGTSSADVFASSVSLFSQVPDRQTDLIRRPLTLSLPLASSCF